MPLGVVLEHRFLGADRARLELHDGGFGRRAGLVEAALGEQRVVALTRHDFDGDRDRASARRRDELHFAFGRALGNVHATHSRDR